MSWSKMEIVQEAYGELALASYVFDLSPEELQFALRRLDTLMATWIGLGINLGYQLGLTPSDTNIEDDSGLPLVAMEAVYLALACRIAASKGKQIPQSTKTMAKMAYDAMLVQIANGQLQPVHTNRGTPAGAGNPRRFYTPYLRSPRSQVSTDAAGDLDFLEN